ncbi:hypothetical protein [uncultured Desulfovibrio sp.]|uniref:GumK N-terminal domain-containing glycosyltransferase n=1 Tax=uncultured Desulfovibrio sp. TaxID=167968 RepID=UPI0025F768EC|nr:hypothetical protein [uncultured Desulfovibrio sp.]
MNIVLLSNHWYPSPRRAGFHHLADAWHAQGHTVSFVTVGFSWISRLRRDFRTRLPGIWQACNTWQHLRERFDSYVLFTAWHPHTTLLAPLDHLLATRLRRYDRLLPKTLGERIRSADVIVYESCVALYLVSRCQELAPHARHIYRVSDDIRTLRSTPASMIPLEQQVAPRFSRISVPCRWLLQKFSGLPQARLDPHGVDTGLFDRCGKDPYSPDTINAVFCGLGFYDARAVHAMARVRRDIQFHIIGIDAPHAGFPENIQYHGEVPFAETIPYIKFADVGLYTLCPSSRRPMQPYTDSLKILQYRYCGLPIVAPDFLDLHREGVFYYTAGDVTSCASAMDAALKHGTHPEYAVEVHTWDEVARALLEE